MKAEIIRRYFYGGYYRHDAFTVKPHGCKLHSREVASELAGCLALAPSPS